MNTSLWQSGKTVRNRRSGVEDLWTNKRTGEPTKLYGNGKRWRARHVDDEGREYTKRFERKRDAQAWLDEATTAKVTGSFVAPARGRVPFKDVAEAWFATKAERKPKTVAGYRSLLDTLVLSRWGTTPVAEVRFEHIQTWIADMRASGVRSPTKGLSASRVRQAHQLLSAVLDYAVRARHITSNPAKGVELPREPKRERLYLTHGEVAVLAAKMGDWKALTYLLAYTGLRWGEATALRARDIDLDRRRLHVARAVTRLGGEYVFGTPKNHATRWVPIPRFLAGLLRDELEGLDDDEIVFATPKGDPLLGDTYRAIFGKHRPYPDLRPHDLRHTAASLAIQSGANIKAVQRMLGHETATLTLDLYGHLFDEDLDRVAESLENSRAYSLRTEGDSSKVVPLRKAP